MNKYQFDPDCPFQTIILHDGINVYIDTEDFDEVIKYHWHNNGKYAATGHDGFRMHHLILGLSDFSILEVHHKNENTYDNTKNNLEILSFSNHLVTRDKQSNNKTGFKGVSWKNQQGTRKGAFIAQISKDGKKIHLGRFKTPEEAARAYDKVARDLFSDVAFLNFPNE